MCEDGNERDDPLRLQLREDIGRHNGLGHSAGSDWGDDIAEDVILQTLLCKSLGKTNKGKLSSCSMVSICSALCFQYIRTRIVRLTKRAEQASRRSGTDEPTILLFPEMRPCGSCALVCTEDVNLIDQVPIGLLHVLEADIAQDTGVVDEDIDAPKSIDCGLDDVLSILDRIVVGDCITACGLDLLDDFVCSLWV